MSLPPQYTGQPGEEQHHYYRNVCLSLKKAIKNTTEPEELTMHMERFLNASREVAWPHSTSSVYHKDEAEKAVQKVVTEFKRYLKDLEANSEKAYPEDLLNALSIVESLIDQLKIR